MAAFQLRYTEDGKGTIKLDRVFTEKDWAALIDSYKEKVNDGVKDWSLDLTELNFISSNSIGMLVALNTSVMANQGSLAVILQQESQVTTQIRFARIDQILTCKYV